MGRAVFAIASPEGYWDRIIGMSYNEIKNFVDVADICRSIAYNSGHFEAFKNREFKAVKLVQDSFVQNEPWTYVTLVENVDWIDYSAIFDPQTNLLEIYSGLFDEEILQKNI
jgi:hypothetical protein